MRQSLKYLVTGCTRLNDMHYPDGRCVEEFLGGALYTLNGIKPYTDEVLFVTTAGPDFDTYYGNYFRRNALSTQGVQFVLPKTEYTILEYSPDGQWFEYSRYGETYEKEWAATALIKAEFVIQNASSVTKGIYFESGVRESVWEDMDKIRLSAPSAKIMWELPTTDINRGDCDDEILQTIKKCDIYSLNLPESTKFFNTISEQDSIQAIRELGIPCFFRVGEKGAYMILNGEVWFSPAIDVDQSMDATGCGNCSTGTALYGYCEGFHPLKTVILANLAAALNARQFGPYPHFTPKLREQLFARAEKIFQAQIGK